LFTYDGIHGLKFIILVGVIKLFTVFAHMILNNLKDTTYFDIFPPFHLEMEEINCHLHVTEVLGQFSLMFGCDVFGIRGQMTHVI
jgi:hypothetical protein